MIPYFFCGSGMYTIHCIGNTQIIHMEETGMTQRTIGLLFHNLTKNKSNKFARNPLFHFQSIKIILGPSDAWLMRRLSQRPSVSY